MKKKIGELTLREFAEIMDRPCSWPCRECKEKHNAEYVFCQSDFEYDSAILDSLLDKEIEEGEENG